MALKPIQLLITAKDEASAVFGSLQAKVMTVGAAIAGYFGIQAFTGAVKGAADLESTLSRVQHATGASAQEMETLKAAAQDAGLTTSFSATQAAEAMENLGKAGLNGGQVIAALPAVLSLATAANQDLATTADQVVSAVMGMGLKFEDAGRVADVLAKGADSTKTSVGGLTQALSYAAPVANSLGLSLEGTVAILGQFAQGGIDASRAGTALNSILSQFSNPASKFREELAAAGITTTNFEKALHQLAAAGARGDKAILAVGQEAGPALRAMLNQGMGALDQLTASLRGAEGAAAATAQAMRDNLNGSLTGLGNVWTSLKDILMTPVLPVLRDGVDQLSAAFRAAIADGTVNRFGEAIATAFKNAVEWTKQFAGSFNWEELRGRMQVFADEVGQKFDLIGQYATNASNAVQLAWGVMTAGANTVMAVIYKIGEAFAGVASNINDGAAWIAEKLSKITFGDVSKRFAAMAQEMRTEAGAFWAASEALAQKAEQSLNAAAEGATLARDAYSAMSGAAVSTSQRIGAAMGAAARSVAEVGAAALDSAQKVVSAGAKQSQAAIETKAKLEALRAEYEGALDSNNWQRAAELLQEIDRVTKAGTASTAALAQEQQEAAAQLAAAFQRAGIETKEELDRMAKTARDDFELISRSGKATAEGVAEAWRRAAEAAIKANSGVAPGWVQAESYMQKYKVQVDAAGRSTLQLEEKTDKAAKTTKSATADMSRSWDGVGESIKLTSLEADHFQKKYGRAGNSPSLSNMERTATVVQGSEDLMNQWIAENLGEQFIGDDRAAQVYGKQSMLDYWTKLGVKDVDGSLAAMRAEVERLKAAMDAERTDNDVVGKPTSKPSDRHTAAPNFDDEDEDEEDDRPRRRRGGRSSGITADRHVTFQLNVNGQASPTFGPVPAGQAAAAEEWLKEVERAQKASVR